MPQTKHTHPHSDTYTPHIHHIFQVCHTNIPHTHINIHITYMHHKPHTTHTHNKRIPFLLKFFLLIFKYGCLHFPTTTLPCSTHTYLPPSILHPFGSMGPLHMFIYNPFPSFPHYFPLRSPLVTVTLLLISMSLVVFCSLVYSVN